MAYTIDGVRCKTEKDVRDYAFNFTKKGIKQDFRLVSVALSAPLSQVLEVLRNTGHTVQEDAF